MADTEHEEESVVGRVKNVLETGGVGRAIHNLEKPRDQWSTGGDPATDAQLSTGARLAQEAGEDPNILNDMNKAEAGEFIEEHISSDPAD